MKRAVELIEISRREFCAGCAGLVLLASCAPSTAPPVATGPLGDSPDAPDQDPPDASDPDARPGTPDAKPAPDAKPGTPDAKPLPDAHPTPDANSGPTCSSTPTDCGAPPSSFASGSPKLIGSKFYVVRDSGGLYALSSKCTHEGATNNVSSGVFLCPRHGAKFTFDGDVISGPVFTGLVHYEMCLLANGNVGVNTSKTVSQSTRM
ncbi:MAG TPA: Rieske 2Fe-2S domain-containing protein [Kofleriaceae bacterium]|jgi:nitrite reductase/ring-hydroxylating ferredoxin subunit|nr:Rieske 2Fe-2S domain-containing protein [Kofleriaceae bacterium]